MRSGAKHTLCRRLGSCVWGNPKCPSVKRPYSAGQHGNAKGGRNKLSTYAQMLLEKQKLRVHYGLTEHQLRFVYQKAQAGQGQTGEKFLRNLELRLSSVVYRSGLVPSIAAARQAVLHRHVQVDGKVVNRSAFHVRPGQVVSIDSQRSPAIAAIAAKVDAVPPPYLELDKEHCKVTVAREPNVDEIPANVNITRVVELYAR
ncbi:MAG: 30S ribosomal protein S4 [Lentisphaeria bacterium]